MKKNWPRLRTFVRWAFALLILLLLFLALSRFDARNVLYSIQQLSLRQLALLLALQIGSQLLVNLQWHQIAKFANIPVSFRQMFYINCQGAVMDSITPGVKIGGEITRSVQISRTVNCPGEQAATVVAMQKLFSLSAFFLINLFALGFLIGNVPFLEARFLQFLVYGIVVLFLLLFLSLFVIPQRIKAYLQARENPGFSWAVKLKTFSLALLDNILSIRSNLKACVLLFALSNLIWLLYPVKMYLLAVQFFPGAGILLTGAAAFASYMVAMLPIFPGGLGGFEGAMSGLLLAMGFMQSDALVITVIFRFVTFWFVLLLAMVFIGFHKLTHRGT